MTEYEKHKKEKKKQIKSLLVKLIVATAIYLKTPNYLNAVRCRQIINQIRIVKDTPIKPKHTPGGITQCNLE